MKIEDSLVSVLNDFLSNTGKDDDGLNWHKQQNLSIQQSVYLFSNFKLLEKICVLLPQETKEIGISFKALGTRVDISNELKRWFNKENILDKLAEASVIGRIFGTGYLIADIDDQQDADQPINYSKLVGIRKWHIKSIGDLQPITDPMNQIVTGYRVINSPIDNPVIHVDRVFVLPGKRLYGDAFIYNGYQHQSYMKDVLQSLFEYIKGVTGTSNMIHDSRLLTYAMKGLGKLIASKDDVGIAKRLQALYTGLKRVSNYRFVLHDADTEEIKYTSYNFSGLDKAVETTKLWLQANCDIPHTKLWNEGSQGNTSGRSETEDWNDVRYSYASNNWLDIIRVIADWYVISRKNLGKLNAKTTVDVEVEPFSSETKLEKAQRLEKKINMISQLGIAGWLTREEVRLNLTNDQDQLILLETTQINDSLEVDLTESDIEDILKNATYSDEIGGYILARDKDEQL